MSLLNKSLLCVHEHNYLPNVQGYIPSVDAMLLILDVKSHRFSHEKTDALLRDLCGFFLKHHSYESGEEMLRCFYESFHKQLRVSYLFEIHDGEHTLNEHYNYVLYQLFNTSNFGFILASYIMMFYLRDTHPDKIDEISYIERLLITKFESLLVCKH